VYQAIVFLPLLGAVIAGLFGRLIGARPSEIVTNVFLFAAMLLSWIAFVAVGFGQQEARVPLFTWMHAGDLKVDWALRIDTLTAVMLVVVTTISAFVHLYSIGYMAEDPHRPRFFSYLSLFTFAMLMLVTSDNLAQLFFGWEGVGLMSYLLIGFWYHKPEANAAAIKAFIVNRIGDFGFALGVFAVFMLVGSIDLDTVFASAPPLSAKTIDVLGWKADALTLVCLLLFMGAMGKSAQFLLHTWLPDAMEGPTPVSALIHAATMVTAGVFMVARLSPLFELSPTAQSVVILVGATTAFFAATVGLVQNDIKRIVAYSTCSQLGYMFVAMGVGAYSVGMFHLFTHAFFKALLFLGSGSVIMAMHHEQDIQKMGGLKDRMPFTYWAMVIGTLALTGFPLTAGYFSKDAIIEAAYAGNNPMAIYGFALTVISVALTSFYSWRLIFKTFHGRPHDHHHYEEAREAPLVVLIPLGFLAAGCIFSGLPFKELFAGHAVTEFFRDSLKFAEGNKILEDLHHVPALVVWLPILMMAAGFLVAWQFYIRQPDLPDSLAEQHDALYRFLLNKWYFDEIYDFLFVRPVKWLGLLLWKGGDGWLIDGFGPDGVSARVLDVTRNVVRLQTGYLYHYAFAMLIGVAALITWFMFAGVR
jgi:NADH-quinone oxidoreductase subunit L